MIFWIAVLVGAAFGILDWHIVDWINRMTSAASSLSADKQTILRMANYLVWLVPLLPTVFAAARQKTRPSAVGAIGSAVWGTAMLAYYGVYFGLMALGRMPGMQHLDIFNPSTSEYHGQLSAQIAFNYAKGELLQWLPIGLVGGFLIGFMMWLLVGKRKTAEETLPVDISTQG